MIGDFFVISDFNHFGINRQVFDDLPSDLLDAVLEAGRKGASLQRYKGLGEMNPEQLWETTLDVDSRTMLQVKVREMDEANDIFSSLMGDDVAPRREFIEFRMFWEGHVN